MKKPEYWEDRYYQGFTSGQGSVGEIRKWKWRVIDSYLDEVDEVIDVGCGDLSFWEGRDCNSYIGMDISPTIIERNRQLRPEWKFISTDAKIQQEISGRVVFCIDVLFHIMDDSYYADILRNLMRYTEEWLFVFTWHKNPFAQFDTYIRRAMRNSHIMPLIYQLIRAIPDYLKAKHRRMVTDGEYQYYRNFEHEMSLFERQGVSHIATHICPYNGQTGAMYVFHREGCPGE